MKGWRRVIQSRRAAATSGRACSAARRSFFVTEAEPVEQPTDRRAVRRDPVRRAQTGHQRVQRQITLLGNPTTHPVRHTVQLATSRIALALWSEAARLAPQLDHVVHETRGNPEMPRRFAMAMPFIDERDHPVSKFHRMWLAHS